MAETNATPEAAPRGRQRSQQPRKRRQFAAEFAELERRVAIAVDLLDGFEVTPAQRPVFDAVMRLLRGKKEE